jgi:hypothetical protein
MFGLCPPRTVRNRFGPNCGHIVAGLGGTFWSLEKALERHRVHIAQVIQKAAQLLEVRTEETILEQARGIQDRTIKLLLNAEKACDPNLTLKAIGEARKNLELLAKLGGQFGPAFGLSLSDVEAFVGLLFEAVKNAIPTEQHESFIQAVVNDPRASSVANALRKRQTLN